MGVRPEIGFRGVQTAVALAAPEIGISIEAYLHSHTGIIQPSDFDQAVELLVQVLRRLDRGTVGELASFR